MKFTVILDGHPPVKIKALDWEAAELKSKLSARIRGFYSWYLVDGWPE
jgi:hypothetical protein